MGAELLWEMMKMFRNGLKTFELYNLNQRIVWYVDYVFINLFKSKLSKAFKGGSFSSY